MAQLRATLAQLRATAALSSGEPVNRLQSGAGRLGETAISSDDGWPEPEASFPSCRVCPTRSLAHAQGEANRCFDLLDLPRTQKSDALFEV